MALKLLTVVGARPQFIKAAAVSRAVRSFVGVEEVLVHTGQHFDSNMSAVFFSELDIAPPTHFLDIHGGSHGAMTGRMLEALENVMIAEKPAWVLVYGDTNSTLAGALAAAKLHIPVAHVEAGLRSFNRRMPEEVNRVLTDHLSSLLFCPTSTAVTNLSGEGIVDGVKQVGDVMFDATLFSQKASASRPILEQLNLRAGDFCVATIHRADTTDDAQRLARVFEFLRAQSRECKIVLPLHPRTRSAVELHGIDVSGLVICEPLGYLDMAKLLSASRAVFTDSGGLQKEAYFHRKPCVTLREETEWVETIECGWNRLWTVPEYLPRRPIEEYGGGTAASDIVRCILNATC